MALKLTDIEEQELEARPISIEWCNYTEEQLTIRKLIATKMWNTLMTLDTTMPIWAKNGYQQCPPWKFYTDKSGNSIRRVYGAMENNFMHAVSAMMIFNNYVLGGVSVDELVAIENWTEKMKHKLRSTPTPGLFLDPLGFIEFIKDNSK